MSTNNFNFINLTKNFGYILAIPTAIIAIVGFILQQSAKNPKIELKSVAIDKLTDFPSVDGLQAKFTYNGDTVTSLYKLNYIIENAGEETLIGEGNQKNLIRDNISFKLPEGYKILEVRISNKTFPFKYSFKENSFWITFMQWKPEEFFEVAVFAEPYNADTIPFINVNEREIIDGEVMYAKVQAGEKKSKPLNEYIPPIMSMILNWTGILIFGIMTLGAPVGFVKQLFETLTYKKWEKKYLQDFYAWEKALVESGILKISNGNYFTPQSVPSIFWGKSKLPEPETSPSEIGDFIGITIIFLIGLIPLLWLIKF